MAKSNAAAAAARVAAAPLASVYTPNFFLATADGLVQANKKKFRFPACPSRATATVPLPAAIGRDSALQKAAGTLRRRL